jgi:pyruvate kinase
VLRQLNLAWGLTPVLTQQVVGFEEMSSEVDRVLLERGLAQEGDTVLTVAGHPFYVRGLTNLLKLHRVGIHESAEVLGL